MKLDLIRMTTKKEEDLILDRKELKNMRVEVEVGYRCNDNILLIYAITVRCGNSILSTMEIVYKILKEDVIYFSDLKNCLDKAVDELQERIEILIALTTEEMGYEIKKEIN